MAIPQTLLAGDSFRTEVDVDAYPADTGWLAKLRLVPRAAGAQAVDLVATPQGQRHVFSASAVVTAAWAAGAYGWALWLERAGESHTVGQGQVQVLPDSRQMAAGVDTRSTARKALDDLNIALAAWNPLRKSYTIGDRTMEFNSTAEIIKLINHWQLQVDAEDRTAGRKARMPRRIYTRL